MDDAIPPSTPPPPQFTAPPPVIVPPSHPRPQRRGGRGWMVCSIILLVLLALSTLVIFSQFAGSVMHVRSGTSMTSTRYVGPRLDEAVLEDNNA